MKSTSNYGRVREISTIVKNKKDDLWIGCANIEQRCLGASELARKMNTYRVENAIILCFDQKDIDESMWDLVIKHRDQMISNLKNIANRIIHIDIPLKKSMDVLSKIRDLCEISNIPLDNATISIDISVLTKRHIFVLLYYLDMERNNNTIRALYTFPAEYAIHKGEPMNRALDDIASIYRFGGVQSFRKGNLLIAFLGFEGQRTFAVWERIEPDKTIAVVGHPPFKKRWDIDSEILNEELLSANTVEIQYAPILDPHEVYRFLCDIYKKHSEKYNLIITPMGPKYQALGVYMFAREHRDVQIIYTIPSRFRIPFSSGAAETWECVIPKITSL